MNRKFIVRVRIHGCVTEELVWAPNRHKAKAQVAREAVDNRRASNFIQACNEIICGCRLARPDPIREAVYDVLRWEEESRRGAGALGAE
jgi:hypothetical protein